ncbi:MAG: hypothetical protein J6M37_06170 [Prevotella sp.]|nr:hypothetical protein [Prevotella sp.]
MNEVILTVDEIRDTTPELSYNKLKDKLEELRTDGVTKVIFPANDNNNKILSLEIPLGGTSIVPPLQIDFNGWTLQVKNNNTSLFFLFAFGKWDAELKRSTYVTNENIDKLDFRDCPNLSSGRKLLVLEDRKEWVYRTDSYDTEPKFRKDILVLNDGVGINTPIASYKTPSTALAYGYYDISEEPVVIENLIFKRDLTSSCVTCLLSMAGRCDVTFNNIHIGFLQDVSVMPIPFGGDCCFRLVNCANVTFRNIIVNHTYSSNSDGGYAFNLENVYNCYFYNVSAMAYWGVFGTNNMNKVYLYQCTLNRFDIHCYGKDVRMVECTFENTLSVPNRYNQFSSFYGLLYFEKCIFKSFSPVLFESSHHAYSGHDIVLDNCTLNGITPENAIIRAGLIENSNNKRIEFSKTNWPNVHVINLELDNYPSGTTLYIFKLLSAPVSPNTNTLGYISQLSVSLSEDSPNVTVSFSNYNNLVTDNEITSKSTHNDITITNMPSHV